MTVSQRILVVEDNADLRELLRLLLNRSGYEVQVAVDGADGMAKAQANPPDAMLVDLIMPGIDGLELATRLRAESTLPTIPILMYSGIPETDPRVAAVLRIPGVGYQIKGSPRQLPAALGELLKGATASPN